MRNATYLSNVGSLGSGATCKCLKLTEIRGHNQQVLCGFTNLSKAGKFEPHKANCEKTDAGSYTNFTLCVKNALTCSSGIKSKHD